MEADIAGLPDLGYAQCGIGLDGRGNEMGTATMAKKKTAPTVKAAVDRKTIAVTIY